MAFLLIPRCQEYDSRFAFINSINNLGPVALILLSKSHQMIWFKILKELLVESAFPVMPASFQARKVTQDIPHVTTPKKFLYQHPVRLQKLHLNFIMVLQFLSHRLLYKILERIIAL